jgi:hypothetical protein
LVLNTFIKGKLLKKFDIIAEFSFSIYRLWGNKGWTVLLVMRFWFQKASPVLEEESVKVRLKPIRLLKYILIFEKFPLVFILDFGLLSLNFLHSLN